MSLSELKQLERERGRINSRIWAIEHAKDQERSEGVVGRYFKYHNSFSGSDRWWLYFKAVRADGQYVRGPKFQRDSNGRFELEPDYPQFSHMSGWVEIEGAEYVRARATFMTEFNEGMGGA